MSEKITKSDVLLICRRLCDKAHERDENEKADGIMLVSKDITDRIDRGQSAEKALLNILYASLKGILPDQQKINGIIETLGELVKECNKYED